MYDVSDPPGAARKSLPPNDEAKTTCLPSGRRFPSPGPFSLPGRPESEDSKPIQDQFSDFLSIYFVEGARPSSSIRLLPLSSFHIAPGGRHVMAGRQGGLPIEQMWAPNSRFSLHKYVLLVLLFPWESVTLFP